MYDLRPLDDLDRVPTNDQSQGIKPLWDPKILPISEKKKKEKSVRQVFTKQGKWCPNNE